ncbi:MAG: glycyl-radical enzyme activating protein [Eubacteriales bacterium]|nr:glycyl-radical enzyme activating protein [Eubacteriales bacterium]
MAEGIVFDIKEFTLHDGPGIRITVFLKGCPLRCAWCHNPEGLSFEPQIMKSVALCKHCGKCERGCSHDECAPFGVCTKICPDGLIRIAGRKVDSARLALELKEQADFLSGFGGGVTISGGEPLAQAEFTLSLLKELKPVHTAVETSGYGGSDLFTDIIESADLILFDLKLMRSELHLKYTGKDNRLILTNFDILADSDTEYIVRIPLIPGVSDTEDNIERTAIYLKSRMKPGKGGSLPRIELMPYNRFAGAKYPAVGMRYDPPFDEKRKVEIRAGVFGRYGLEAHVI